MTERQRKRIEEYQDKRGRKERGSGHDNKIQCAECFYCHRACVSERPEETHGLSPSLLFSLSTLLPPVSLHFFFHSPWSQRSKLNYKLWICPWNLTLALLQFLLKQHEGTKSLRWLTPSLLCHLCGQMAWPEPLWGPGVSQHLDLDRKLFSNSVEATADRAPAKKCQFVEAVSVTSAWCTACVVVVLVHVRYFLCCRSVDFIPRVVLKVVASCI